MRIRIRVCFHKRILPLSRSGAGAKFKALVRFSLFRFKCTKGADDGSVIADIAENQNRKFIGIFFYRHVRGLPVEDESSRL